MSYPLKGFTYMHGGQDEEVFWSKTVKPGEEYHFIDLMCWEGLVGEREAADLDYRYTAELSVVLLPEIPPREIREALDCCGLVEYAQTLHADKRFDTLWAVMAEACFQYGAKAHAWKEDGNNWNKLRRAARLASEEAEVDNSYLHKVVNRIGSTAIELMRGDLTSAMKRADPNDLTTRIIAKMYVASEGTTLGGHIDESSPGMLEACREILSRQGPQ